MMIPHMSLADNNLNLANALTSAIKGLLAMDSHAQALELNNGHVEIVTARALVSRVVRLASTPAQQQ